MKYFFLSLITIIISVFLLIPFASYAQDCSDTSFWSSGIVPCGRNCDNLETRDFDESQPCTLCHFIVGFWNVIHYGFKILVFVALTCLVIAGIMYIVSAGSEKMIETAKTFIKQILFGFAIVLLGWVFIFTVMNYFAVKSDLGIGKTEGWTKFTCNTESTGAYQGESKETITAKYCCVIGEGKCGHVKDASKCTNGKYYEKACSEISECSSMPNTGNPPSHNPDDQSGEIKIEASPSSIDFGYQTIGFAVPQSITFTNKGNIKVQVKSISFSDSKNFNWSSSSLDIGKQLDPGSSLILNSYFVPTKEGLFTGNLTVTFQTYNTSDLIEKKVVVDLQGRGVTTESNNKNENEKKDVDLIVTRVRSASSVNNYEPTTVTLYIENKGSSNSGPFTVSIYYGFSIKPGGNIFAEWNVANLDPGQKLTSTFSRTLTSLVVHAKYYFVVQIDSKNSVNETNEENNVYYRSFTVGN